MDLAEYASVLMGSDGQSDGLVGTPVQTANRDAIRARPSVIWTQHSMQINTGSRTYELRQAVAADHISKEEGK